MDNKVIYYYGFYKLLKGGKMECVVTYGLREGLTWQVKGYSLCIWANTRTLAAAKLKQYAREKGYKV